MAKVTSISLSDLISNSLAFSNCVCVCVCVCARARACVRASMRVCACVRARVSMSVCVSARACMCGFKIHISIIIYTRARCKDLRRPSRRAR